MKQSRFLFCMAMLWLAGGTITFYFSNPVGDFMICFAVTAVGSCICKSIEDLKFSGTISYPANNQKGV